MTHKVLKLPSLFSIPITALKGNIYYGTQYPHKFFHYNNLKHSIYYGTVVMSNAREILTM
jgi:hypothetical protein